MEPEGLNLMHGMYADDVNIVLEAIGPNILRCKQLFGIFDQASGLLCNWDFPTAVFISPNPLPEELLALNWTWETGPNFLKLLGFYIRENIPYEDMIA